MTIPEAKAAKKPIPRFLYFAIIALILLITVAIGNSIFISNRIIEVYYPLQHSVHDIMLESSAAHLDIGEYLLHDTNTNVEEGERHFNRIDGYIDSILSQKNGLRMFLSPLGDPALRSLFEKMKENVRVCRGKNKQLFASRGNTALTAVIRQQYHNALENFQKIADESEDRINDNLIKNTGILRSIQNTLIALCLLLSIAIGVVLYRTGRRISSDMIFLQEKNNQLEAMNQQFIATEQQLRTSNQQLLASEHQLKTMNEQLIAAEEQLKTSLREKDILLKEIHHRVKNNLQIIHSLLNLQESYLKDKNVLRGLKESRNRIRTMSLLHEKLYQSEDIGRIAFSEYIDSLAQELYRVYGVDRDRVRLNLDIENIILDIDAAVPCGLMISELISNSLKYAFPDERAGSIAIGMRKVEGKRVELRISDNGIGIPENIDIRSTETLGLHLVTILAEDQLGGEISLDRTNGVKFLITFKELDIGEKEIL